MANLSYSRELTALLVIDPYNDFISEGGKIWDRIRVCVAHMLQVLSSARKTQLRFLYALHRCSSGRLHGAARSARVRA
jgi:ureidoacrylate peracid hydrolase